MQYLSPSSNNVPVYLNFKCDNDCYFDMSLYHNFWRFSCQNEMEIDGFLINFVHTYVLKEMM